MNREALEQLADFIADTPHTFDMRNFIIRSPCGTTACIAGHAALLFEIEYSEDWPEEIADYLGLNRTQCTELFFPEDEEKRFLRVDQFHAARVIRKLIATGEVKWKD